MLHGLWATFRLIFGLLLCFRIVCVPVRRLPVCSSCRIVSARASTFAVIPYAVEAQRYYVFLRPGLDEFQMFRCNSVPCLGGFDVTCLRVYFALLSRFELQSTSLHRMTTSKALRSTVQSLQVLTRCQYKLPTYCKCMSVPTHKPQCFKQVCVFIQQANDTLPELLTPVSLPCAPMRTHTKKRPCAVS